MFKPHEPRGSILALLLTMLSVGALALASSQVLAQSNAAAKGAPLAAPPAAPSPANTDSSGINVNSMPPPPSAFTNDPVQLERQAEEAAAKAAADDMKRSEDHNKESYNRASAGLSPLSNDQIRDFMHKMQTTQEAEQAPFAGPPKAEVKVATILLDPGIEPQQINLAAGYVTTINILDSTGEPWPILDVGIGGNFEVTPTTAGAHVVRIMPLTRVGTGNLSILLKDLSTPVIFRLAAGGPTVHMRFDARIPKYGPNAKIPLIDRGRHGPVAGDEVIMMILQNAPPAAAKRMKVSGLDARTMAWQMDNKVFVRTPLSMLSPAWNSSVADTDGMTVYEIGDAPVLLMSDNGAMVRARLMRDDEHDK